MLVNVLAKCNIFEGVERSYLEYLIKNHKIYDYKEEEYVFHQGEIGKGMFVVLEGKFLAIVEVAEDNELNFTIEKSSFFGEIGVLTKAHRTASVKALEDSRLLYLDKEAFEQKVREKNINALLISNNIARALAARLEKTLEIFQTFKNNKSNHVNEIAKYREQLLADGLI